MSIISVKHLLSFLFGVAFLFASNASFSVTKPDPKKRRAFYAMSTKVFKPSMSFPVIEKERKLIIPPKNLLIRAKNSRNDERIEPIKLYMEDEEAKIRQMAARLSKPGKTDALLSFFKKKIALKRKQDPKSKRKEVDVSEYALKLMNLSALGKIFERRHHSLSIPASVLRKNRKLRREFLRQIVPFTNKKDFSRLRKMILSGREIYVDRDLLPRFARRMVGKFVVYRGPNCFHSALAFQSPALTRSTLINVKKEKGYHRAMINYDELWRVLNTHFYEVDPRVSKLQFGDTLVFFDLPKDEPSYPPNFKWIRHTASYLFGQYTFSKGSKSPNTPYSVKTLKEEWETWQKYSKKLAVKVFRRSTKNVNKKPPKVLTDWLY